MNSKWQSSTCKHPDGKQKTAADPLDPKGFQRSVYHTRKQNRTVVLAWNQDTEGLRQEGGELKTKLGYRTRYCPKRRRRSRRRSRKSRRSRRRRKGKKNAKYGELKFHSIAGKSNSFTIKTPLV